MRYYFTTQAELVRFLAEGMTESVARRIRAGLSGAPDQQGLQTIVEELLPLDASRRAEFEVWLELVMLARTEPELRPLSVQAHTGIHTVCSSVVQALAPALSAQARAGEVEALHALLDGLALHLALYPRHTTAPRVREVVRAHLNRLVTSTHD